jgi:hypothetical protein
MVLREWEKSLIQQTARSARWCEPAGYGLSGDARYRDGEVPSAEEGSPRDCQRSSRVELPEILSPDHRRHELAPGSCWAQEREGWFDMGQFFQIFQSTMMSPELNRVGGGIAPPASHTTGHAGPHPAVPARLTAAV